MVATLEKTADISGLLNDTEQNPSDLSDGLATPLGYSKFIKKHPDYNRPLIPNLLREGETMNLIAAPKVGKSWLAADLILSAAMGLPWLDSFELSPCNVLLLDNELHGGSISRRLEELRKAKGIDSPEALDNLDIVSLRGNLRDLRQLGRYFENFQPGQYQLIVLDAFYRTLPAGVDENDNRAIAGLYNLLDAYAEGLKCAFVLVHHSSKGSQAGKSVTDVGAGAGSQSRAADSHMVLRQHQEDNAVVFDAVVRTWPPIQHFCLRWDYPCWHRDDSLDPKDLENGQRKNKKIAKDKDDEITFEEFFRLFFSGGPVRKVDVIQRARKKLKISRAKVEKFIEKALGTNWLYKHFPDGKNRSLWLSKSPPKTEE